MSHPHTKAAAGVAAVRAARGAPQMSLEVAAAAAGVSARMLKDRLRSLRSRGVCHDTALELTKSRRRVGERSAALNHRGCPPPLTRAAASDSSDAARGAGTGTACWASRGGASPAAPRSVMATVAVARTSAYQIEAQTAVAVSPVCPPLFLAQMAKRSARALANPGCAPHTLAEMSASHDRYDLKAVARHRRSPLPVLVTMAAHSDADVRAVAMSNVRCPQRLLPAAARDSAAVVRTAVARRTTCPPRLLGELTADTVREVRAAAAANPATPQQKGIIYLSDHRSVLVAATLPL